jgi:hypothetical protein
LAKWLQSRPCKAVLTSKYFLYPFGPQTVIANRRLLFVGLLIQETPRVQWLPTHWAASLAATPQLQPGKRTRTVTSSTRWTSTSRKCTSPSLIICLRFDKVSTAQLDEMARWKDSDLKGNKKSKCFILYLNLFQLSTSRRFRRRTISS